MAARRAERRLQREAAPAGRQEPQPRLVATEAILEVRWMSRGSVRGRARSPESKAPVLPGAQAPLRPQTWSSSSSAKPRTRKTKAAHLVTSKPNLLAQSRTLARRT